MISLPMSDSFSDKHVYICSGVSQIVEYMKKQKQMCS